MIIKTVCVRFGLVRNTGKNPHQREWIGRDGKLKFAGFEAGPTPHYATGARDLTFDYAWWNRRKGHRFVDYVQSLWIHLFWGWNACFGVASGVAKTQQKPWRPARPVDRNLFGTSVPCSWIRYERRVFFAPKNEEIKSLIENQLFLIVK